MLHLAGALGVQGYLAEVELDKLIELAANKDVLEIGSFKGLSAWGMAISAKSLTCVDTFQADDGGQLQMGKLTTLEMFKEATKRYNNIKVVIGQSMTVEIAGDFDMIFLDAMHTREEVTNDITRWWTRLRPGGIFAMHDYRITGWPGVHEASDAIFGPAPPGTTCHSLRWINKPI